MSKAKWNLIIDVDRCNNCCNCVIAAKDEHVGNDFPGYAAPQPKLGHRWVDVETVERGKAPMIDVVHVPRLCNHCDDAPCVEAGKGAVAKRADGIVIIDPVKAKGRRDLVEVCPYGAVWWNEELQLPQAWIFDAHLLDHGRPQPRCVTICPTEAMRAVKVADADMSAIARREGLEVLRPELGTSPRVYYRHLSRAVKAFIGGQVETIAADGRRDCAEGALVSVSGACGRFETTTDEFGEYRVDNLPPHSGRYTVIVELAGRQVASLEIDLGRSAVAPTIILT